MKRDLICGMKGDEAVALEAKRTGRACHIGNAQRPRLTQDYKLALSLIRLRVARALGATIMTRAAIFAAALVVIASNAWGSELTPAFESALERNAEIQAMIARRGEIEAQRQAADSLLPAPPSIELGATSDWAARDLGANEFEVGLAAPIWLPGERGATRDTIDASAAKLEADVAVKRLEIARAVREAFWDVVERRELLALSEQKRDAARALTEDARRRVKAGLTAQADAHLAEADRQDAEGDLVERATDLEQAIITFRILAGVDPPSMTAEPEPAALPEHPGLNLPRRTRAVAEAEIRLAAVADREPPEIGLLTRVERGDREEKYGTLFGIRVRIPFSGEQRNAPRRAAALAARSAAAAELVAAERDIEAETAKARAALSGAERRAKAAEARFVSQEAAFGFSEQANRAGELSLAELIRLRAQMFDAANARSSARIAVERARSNLIQAHGIEP